MRKLIVILLCAVIMLLSFAGCAPKAPATPTAPACEHEYTSRVLREATIDKEGDMEYFCKKCNDIYHEAIPKKELHIISTTRLHEVFSDLKFNNGMFSIHLDELVRKAVGNYNIEFVHGEEAIKEGYLNKSDLGSNIDVNDVYYVVVSGDVMVNPELPYYTIYTNSAIKGWIQFDANDNPIDCNITLCEDLKTCAILLMAGY